MFSDLCGYNDDRLAKAQALYTKLFKLELGDSKLWILYKVSGKDIEKTRALIERLAEADDPTSVTAMIDGTEKKVMECLS